MKKLIELECGGYYLFESLASGRSCYFESDIEGGLFRRLFRRYMEDYAHIHKMYLSSEGYQILLRLKGRESLERRYKKACKKKGVEVKKLNIEEPWRIISERMRVFGSVYVKAVNRIRGRKGVLVQERYGRYEFSEVEEFESYIEEMERGKEVQGQDRAKYRVGIEWKSGVNWVLVRGSEWVESLMSVVFRDFVIDKMLN